MSGGGKPVIGHKYSMGLHAGLSHGPVDELVEIRGGNLTLWQGSQTASGQISIDAANAYGGEKKEGGVAGVLDVMMGESTQVPNAYLSSVIGGVQTAFRGLMTVVFRKGYIGANNPYPKPWSFRVRRATKGWDSDNPWYPAKAQITQTGSGAQLSINHALTGDMPNGTALLIGGSIGAYSVGDTPSGSTQISVTNASGVTTGMSLTTAALPVIPGGTTVTVISGPLIKAMNPAHIIYETLTNRDWGMGYPTGIINTVAFTTAADQLYSEGFGLCLLWRRQDSIESFIQQVIDHIAAVLVQSRTTGLFELNLIRGGYDVGALPTFTVDNVIDVVSYESPAITGATNEILVKWNDPTTKTTRITPVQSLGAIQSQGVIVSQPKDYPGIAEPGLAARVGERDLRATAIPLKRLVVKLDRRAYTLMPGGLFVLSFPPYGIDSMVFRCGEVDYGSLTDGAITVTAVQDVFALPVVSYVTPPPTGWVAPDNKPYPPSNYAAFDLSYRDLFRNLTPAELAAVTPAGGYAGMVAARPTGLSVTYDVWSSVGAAPYVERGTATFCPSGTLQSAVQPFDTTITILAGDMLDTVTLPCAGMMENEIVAITALNPTTGVATIGRGCVDTVPVAHPVGARIWLYDDCQGSDGVEYFALEAVHLKPLTNGVLPLGSAPVLTANIVNRQNLPYPAANFRVQGTRWDQVVRINPNPVTLTWSQRNRITQMDQLVDNLAGTITPEAGVTYTVTLKDGAGSGFATFTGITGTTWTWPTPDDTHASVGMTLMAVRAGASNYQSQVLPATTRVGYGLNYGNNYGSL